MTGLFEGEVSEPRKLNRVRHEGASNTFYQKKRKVLHSQSSGEAKELLSNAASYKT